MKPMDRCDSCKHLRKDYNYYKNWNLCDKLCCYLRPDYYDREGTESVVVRFPEEFGCIAWEAKDETN